MVEAIRCGEWGSAEHERWSTPWVPVPQDNTRLEALRDQKIVELDWSADGKVRIAGRDFCGRIRLPSGQIVEIASKVPLLSLIQWLAFTDTLPELEDWTDSPTLGPNGSLADAVALFYIEQLTHLTKFHWRHGYTVARAVTSNFRGRLDVRHFAKSAQRLPALPCVYRERTMHTTANCVLARALDATWRLVDHSRLSESSRRKLDWLTQQWSAIEREVPSLTQAVGQVISRPPVGYRGTLRLARLLLQGVAVDAVGGDGGDIFLVNMSTVWEEGLRRMLGEWASTRGLPVGGQAQRTRQWDDATGKHAPNRWLSVDAMLATKEPIVFDAKYKRGFGNEARGDRFQMAAYAMGFGAVAAVLVYPTGVAEAKHRLLMKTALPGVASEIASLELPMARGPRECQREAERAFERLHSVGSNEQTPLSSPSFSAVPATEDLPSK